MWLEICLCSLGISFSMSLHLFSEGSEFIRLLPLTLAYATLCFLFFPTRIFKQMGVLFFIGVQLGTLSAWASALAVLAACLRFGKEVFDTPFIHGKSKITACLAMGFLFTYFFFKVLGVDRDLLFVPLFFAWIFSLWIWAVWESRKHTAFKIFVLGAMIVHLFEMWAYLIPHPPRSRAEIHTLPFLFFFTPLLYLGIRTARKSSLFSRLWIRWNKAIDRSSFPRRSAGLW